MFKQIFYAQDSRLNAFKETFERFLQDSISHLGEPNLLREACAYALLNGGKRMRPLIVMSVSHALGHHLDVLQPSLSVEYFHTASLIADDLPCMDNDDFRRSQPALHKKYGQATALLASYTLIAAGYKKIFQGGQVLSLQKAPFRALANERCVLALDAASRCAGMSGATGGQFQDLYPREKTMKQALDTIYKKTISLFEVSFVFGWIFGGGNLEDVERIRTIAYHFGLAFQIADDLDDATEDRPSSLNLAHLIGKAEAKQWFEKELQACMCKMKKLGLDTPEFQQMLQRLSRI